MRWFTANAVVASAVLLVLALAASASSPAQDITDNITLCYTNGTVTCAPVTTANGIVPYGSYLTMFVDSSVVIDNKDRVQFLTAIIRIGPPGPGGLRTLTLNDASISVSQSAAIGEGQVEGVNLPNRISAYRTAHNLSSTERVPIYGELGMDVLSLDTNYGGMQGAVTTVSTHLGNYVTNISDPRLTYWKLGVFANAAPRDNLTSSVQWLATFTRGNGIPAHMYASGSFNYSFAPTEEMAAALGAGNPPALLMYNPFVDSAAIGSRVWPAAVTGGWVLVAAMAALML
ncbi:hypothetical protein HDU87_007968 [Geranomyces variabilis]|uniref:Uncharacterized protein n=1 Tax=Geranomyces variabilis TaxID=109894 RepID=A0AAD5XTF1_9FUNG|nr:hypothetical protein HDU87_007968 [Geranomyces variabilis]